ncbi:MAG: hypothetical protein U0796_21365 [Gemmatales bacterium]
MNAQNDAGSPPSNPLTHEMSGLVKSWRLAAFVAGFMILLAMLGVGLTYSNSQYSARYWMWISPVFGILCIGTAWSRGSLGMKRDFSLVFQQLLHWLGVTVAIGLDFLIKKTGEENSPAAGMSALLILALGCFLAGIHLEWLFTLVGVLLAITLCILAKAEQYQWLLFLIGGLVLLGIFIWHRLRHRFFQTK